MSSEELDFDIDIPTQRYKALYDYTYKDDDGTIVEMRTGDEYLLLQKSGEWWEVIRSAGNTDECSFYVPANYVAPIEDANFNSANVDTKESDLKPARADEALSAHSREMHTCIETGNEFEWQVKSPLGIDSPTQHSIDMLREKEIDEPLYSNSNVTQSHTTFGKSATQLSTNNNLVIKPGYVRKSLDMAEEGDYANLEDLRIKAGISLNENKNINDDKNDIYVNIAPGNLQFNPTHQRTPSSPTSPTTPPEEPPTAEEGTFKRTLLKSWDEYEIMVNTSVGMRPKSYYIHRETNHRSWKPPRDKNTRTKVPVDGKKENLETTVPVTLTKVPDVKIHRASDPSLEGWRLDSSSGQNIYTHAATNQKWRLCVDSEGRNYYFNLTTEQSAWELPKLDSKTGEQDTLVSKKSSGWHSPRSRSPVQRSASQRSPQIPRSVKTQSLYFETQLNLSSPSNAIPPGQGFMTKSFTLPKAQVSDTDALDMPKSLTLPSNMNLEISNKSSGPPPSTAPKPEQERICGTLKKKLVVDGGKKCEKKDKAATCFAKLLGTNLVFYKDRKASLEQKGRQGKPELIEPIQGADIKRSQNKKNCLVFSSCNNNQYHLQFDDEKSMQTWLTAMELAIRELGPCKVNPDILDLSEKPTRQPSMKSHQRHMSDAEPNSASIKGWLDKWLGASGRPSESKLVQKGIIRYDIFGGHLHEICEKEKSKVPTFVKKCAEAVEKRGLEHDGLYRISGNMAQINKIRTLLNNENFKYEALDNRNIWDVHVLTGSLKLFFRELKEPVFTYSLYDKFMSGISKQSVSDRRKAVKECINSLPKYNYETLKFLFIHLLKVAEESDKNRMNIPNIAIVFGPTLIWKERETNHLTSMTNMVLQGQLIEFVLLEFKNLFK